MDKEQAQSTTQALPAWWSWEVVRAGGVGTMGMGKTGRFFKDFFRFKTDYNQEMGHWPLTPGH
jgi:hypothetical protein